MKIEKYKPKVHTGSKGCGDDCDRDCNMECDICRATPWDTKFYYIIEGENHNPQFCEKCFKKLKTEIKNEM